MSEGIPKIKFSHWYEKLNHIYNTNCKHKECVLLAIFKTHRKDLHEQFVRYDTEFWDELSMKHYELPKTDLLVLLFVSNVNGYSLFTTTRKWTPQKEQYYKSKVGKLFEVEITK